MELNTALIVFQFVPFLRSAFILQKQGQNHTFEKIREKLLIVFEPGTRTPNSYGWKEATKRSLYNILLCKITDLALFQMVSLVTPARPKRLKPPLTSGLLSSPPHSALKPHAAGGGAEIRSPAVPPRPRYPASSSSS